MSNPKAEGQPDTYAGTNWVSQIVAQEAHDYCGVHNSGVLNHWFYILTQGKLEQTKGSSIV
jgi:Zn-dependent metalloprotease